MTSNTMSAADYDNAFLSSGANNGVWDWFFTDGIAEVEFGYIQKAGVGLNENLKVNANYVKPILANTTDRITYLQIQGIPLEWFGDDSVWYLLWN
jgi:hypothetical protein